MSNAPFTADEVCAILEACSASGVRSFSYGGLSFQAGTPEVAPPDDKTSTSPQLRPQEVTVFRQNEQKVSDQKTTELLEEVLFTDPLLYEELIASGALEKDSNVREIPS